MNVEKPRIIPKDEQRRLRNSRIKALYRGGMSMDDICRELKVSKTTVFYVVGGKKKNKP